MLASVSHRNWERGGLEHVKIFCESENFNSVHDVLLRLTRIVYFPLQLSLYVVFLKSGGLGLLVPGLQAWT